MDEQTKNKIANAILVKNVSIKDVAKKLFISEKQLRLLLNDWGIELPKKRKTVPAPQREHLMEIYAKQGNTGKTAKYLGVSIGTVIRWMKKMNIPMKKMGNMTTREKVAYLEKHLSNLDHFNF